MRRNEAELIKGIMRGDCTALHDLYDTFFARLHRFAWHLTRDTIAAEDIVHDVFLKIWSNRSLWSPGINLSGYLYRAVKNQALNHLRSRKSRGEVRINADIVSPEQTDAEAELEDLRHTIQHCVDALPPGCRTVFILSRYEEMKYQDIAVSLGISPKTVENQMGRALRKLRICLAKLLE